jgi:hypothetical protein
MLQPQHGIEIPEMTQLVAKAAFPKGTIFTTLRDELGPIFEIERFVQLYLGTC